ncbi:OmpA family protein [Hymenobacter bucti]|uniref:OmpA family protein n=1 Tax=Hymenobacter bucti TaxID=1844114 RepID=A0ABW4QPN7_9BACT
MTTPKTFMAMLMAFVMLLGSCASTRPASDGSLSDNNGTGARKTGMTKANKGGLLGAGGGAILGGVVGGLIGGGRGTAAGAILGAAVGGGTGAIIGRRMDKQAAELQRDMANAKVERVGEGIKITFDSGILFDTNSSDLRPASQSDVSKLAATLQKYADTNVLVEGHTDNTGTDAINQPLSERRAQSVANGLTAQQVASSRITTKGLGSTDPIADNTTVEGRQANRRVEVAIYANEKMKKAAENGTL